jgi:uncharacterized protein YvpB
MVITASTAKSSVKDIPKEANYSGEIYPTHAYAIVGIDDENIYIKNPHHTNKSFEVPLDVFVKSWSSIAYTEIK